MRFRFCCTCDEDEENVNKDNGAQRITVAPSTALPAPAVITQQPKHEEPIPLDSRISEESVGKSPDQATTKTETQEQESAKEKPSIQPIPAPESITEEISKPEPPKATPKEDVSPDLQELYRTMLQVLAEKPSTFERSYIPPVTQPVQQVNPGSSITGETMIGDEKLEFQILSPEFFQGTFKGSRFHIVSGKFMDYYLAFNESDKAAIKLVYDRVMDSMNMKQCEKGLESGISTFNSQDDQFFNLPPGSTINTNYVTSSGNKAIMTFRPIGQGQFQSTYKGIEFTISNTCIKTTGGNFDDKDQELIWRVYYHTVDGMQQGLKGLKMGRNMMGQQVNAIAGSSTAQGGTAFSGVYMRRTPIGGSAYASAGSGGTAVAGVTIDGNSFAHASSYNILATGRETLKRMRSLNHGKRISLLEGGLIAHPRQPVMVIEDITESSKKPCFADDIDGIEISEPVLEKTTFTTNAVIYQDPKTYEQQDKNELPVAKGLDGYIISMDENFNSGNRYYFHEARPRRVNRRKLVGEEQFQIASPERYFLFEGECLKAHNEYRKIHGVPPLVHSEFLSQVAKEWAEHLALKDAFYHRPKNEYGENLYYADRIPCCAKTAVKAWYDEIDLYDYDKPKFSKETGHFTQLVWKDTREVGTGVAQIGEKVWVCCNYHPPGNYGDKFNDEFVPRPVIKRSNKS